MTITVFFGGADQTPADPVSPTAINRSTQHFDVWSNGVLTTATTVGVDPGPRGKPRALGRGLRQQEGPRGPLTRSVRRGDEGGHAAPFVIEGRPSSSPARMQIVGKIIGVIPAAGHATRLQPLDCSKEVLPIQGRPVVDYLVERMRVGGCSQLRVVTRVEKQDLIEHCERIGVDVVAEPATVGESIAAGAHASPPTTSC